MDFYNKQSIRLKISIKKASATTLAFYFDNYHALKLRAYRLK